MLRRAGALFLSAAVLATMTVATVASPASAASAARPRCQGLPATIVGTARGERIVGTARRDIIVARGGHDRIYGKGGNDVICAGGGNDTVYGGPGADRLWGQVGHDRLFGNAGNDFLAGQIGNDTLNGGINYDTCYQGTGTGAVVSCELPAVPAAPSPPVPDPINLTNVLAIAYSDLNKNHIPDAGDVMIAQLVDPDGNGPDAGDQIIMGKYPTSIHPSWPADFADWGVKSHTVTSGAASADDVSVFTTSGGNHNWFRTNPPSWTDAYDEASGSKTKLYDTFLDNNPDYLKIDTASPSQPIVPVDLTVNGTPDDYFLDVEIYP